MPPSSKFKQWIYSLLQILIVISLALNVLQNPSPKNLEKLQANSLKIFPLSQSELQENNLSELQSGQVISITDGDTIQVILNQKKETIRLIGIDTPETVDPNKEIECYGPEASKSLSDKILNKIVIIETDPSQELRGKYNRLLAYIYLPASSSENPILNNINLWMIQEGYAQEYTYSNSYKYQKEFKTAELKAQENNKGLWKECQQ